MDRDTILRIARLNVRGNVPTNDVKNVIIAYCLEKGKEEKLSIEYTNLLLSMGIAVGAFLIALTYFEKKFNICHLTGRDGNIIKLF